MTEEEFKKLQQQQLESGKTLKTFLQEMGVGYSTWAYWRRKSMLCDIKRNEAE